LNGRVDLVTAADLLGVHYQTAYRWVRDGTLRAAKVGPSYDVASAEVERVLARRSRPAKPPARTKVRHWADQADRLYDVFVAGDEMTARQMVDRLHDGHVSTVEICEQMFVPALRALGEGWAAGRIDVAEEHRASAMCARLLARIAVHPRGRPRGVAIVTTVPGEEHGLPAVMAAMALRADRWQVHHLGTQTPYVNLARMAQRERAELVVLSVTYAATQKEAARMAGKLSTETGVRCLAGAPGASLAGLVQTARGSEEALLAYP
jgi:excisionase family DNA binding protein